MAYITVNLIQVTQRNTQAKKLLVRTLLVKEQK